MVRPKAIQLMKLKKNSTLGPTNLIDSMMKFTILTLSTSKKLDAKVITTIILTMISTTIHHTSKMPVEELITITDMIVITTIKITILNTLLLPTKLSN